MKIIFFTRLFYPHIGGVEKHVMEISKRLIKDGHQVTIVTEVLENPILKEKKDGIDIYRIQVGKNDWFKKFRIWKEIWRLKERIENADIVHCHDVFFWYLPFRFIFWNKPVYTTFHGYEGYPVSKKSIFIRKLSEKLSWKNICIGDFITKWYCTKSTIISYGGVDLGKGKQKVENKVKPESAVFIGRLNEQTGALIYAKTVELLKKKSPKFDLTFVGDGKDKRSIERKFKVLGFQTNPEKYFENHHFAFVSGYLSILEALVAKRLIFAVYDNPLKEDYLRMAPFASWIVIESDPEKLGKKIEYYLNHPEEEQKMIEKGYKWVKDQDWKNLVKLYLSLWDRKVNFSKVL